MNNLLSPARTIQLQITNGETPDKETVQKLIDFEMLVYEVRRTARIAKRERDNYKSFALRAQVEDVERKLDEVLKSMFYEETLF